MKMSNCQRRRLCSSHARSYPSSLLKKHVQSTETAGNKTNMYTNPCMLYHIGCMGQYHRANPLDTDGDLSSLFCIFYSYGYATLLGPGRPVPSGGSSQALIFVGLGETSLKLS